MGRVKQYDEAEVLQKAMLTFWENGYENTSVRTLEKNMGINQFSIYKSFKNKRTLYEKVLNSYTQKLHKEFLYRLKQEDSNLEDIALFLNNFASQILDKKIPNCCLMVQSTTNLEKYDEQLRQVVLDFFESMKRLFVKALVNSKQVGLLPNNAPIDLSAEYLIGIAQSISVYAKVKNKTEVRAYIDFAINRLKQ